MTNSNKTQPGRLLGYQAVSRYILDDTDEDRNSALKAARDEAARRDAVVVELRLFEDPKSAR